MAWTKEQIDAMTLAGNNIVVSAGAGSGKTAVLTERIIKKLESGIPLSSLLVLTFTNAAAAEMKERVRDKIKSSTNPEVRKFLEFVDTSNIMTFDAYSLMLVKKYHQLIGVDSDIKNIDGFYLELKTNQILEEILEDEFKNDNPVLYKFYDVFPSKDMEALKEGIKNIYKAFEIMVDTDASYNEYDSLFYNESNMEALKNEYLALINIKIKELYEMLPDIKNSINDINEHLASVGKKSTDEAVLAYALNFEAMFEKNPSYEDIRSFYLNNIYESKGKPASGMPGVKSAGSSKDEELKELKKIASSKVNTFKELEYEVFGVSATALKKHPLASFSSEEEMIEAILANRDFSNLYIKLAKRLKDRLYELKCDINAFSFNDIAKMAIKLVDENEFIKNEIKNGISEILIDEYQDTSDIQEEFISKISNNNVYMVGDIKQSIYRFRNANPYIFKNKYSNYKNNNGGLAIDLNKNFRSRSEVLDSINLIFNNLMTDEYGDASYKKEHQMNYGFTDYSESFKTLNNEMEIIRYKIDDPEDLEDDYKEQYSYIEKEAFYIAADIKKKIDNKTLIYDKDKKCLRECVPSDFCILMDRGTNFELYKEILENTGLPVAINADIKLNFDDVTRLVSSLIKLVDLESKHIYNRDYYNALMSVGRSFISDLKDEELFSIVTKSKIERINDEGETYKTFGMPIDNPISLCAREISKNINYYSNEDIFKDILIDFKVIERLSFIGNVNERMVIIENITAFIKNVSSYGESLSNIANYLDEMVSEKAFDFKYSLDVSNDPGVKIMNIHKSKGLEFPICYFSLLGVKFNRKDFQKQIGYFNESGIYTVIDSDKEIIRRVAVDKAMKKDISERIRLFYVALTRTREKMIILSPINDIDKDGKRIVKNPEEFNNLNDFMNYVMDKCSPFIKVVDMDDYNLSKDYKDQSFAFKMKYNDKPIYDNKSYKTKPLSKSRISREVLEVLSDREKENIDLGLVLHEIMEGMDFTSPSTQNIDSKYKDMIEKCLNIPFMKTLSNAKTYHEHEFIMTLEGNKYHGIIDLLAEYDDHIDIIDYKLCDLNHSEYDRQLNIYKKYVNSISNKRVNMYLLALSTGEVREVK
ncbi:MAG: UvrD-helicase domain-containing protein [Anaeroplasmataceae bacterium]